MADPIRTKGDSEEPAPILITDRRPRFDDAVPAQSGEAEPGSRFPTVIAEMETRAVRAEGRLAEALDLLRRREAEAEEFRIRLRREMERRAEGRIEEALRDLLEVVDSLDRGLGAAADAEAATLREGLSQVREQFLAILLRHGVEPMHLVGTPFDPHQAEAVAVSPPDEGRRANEIVEEIRRGYSRDGRVLRPAQVRVAGPGAPGES